MARLSGACASSVVMSRVFERIIAPKIPIKLCGDESTKCSGSSRRDPHSVFSAFILPSKTLSIINDISSLGRRFGSLGPKQPPSGKPRFQPNETVFNRQFFPFSRYRDNAARRHRPYLPREALQARGVQRVGCGVIPLDYPCPVFRNVRLEPMMSLSAA